MKLLDNTAWGRRVRKLFAKSAPELIPLKPSVSEAPSGHGAILNLAPELIPLKPSVSEDEFLARLVDIVMTGLAHPPETLIKDVIKECGAYSKYLSLRDDDKMNVNLSVNIQIGPILPGMPKPLTYTVEFRRG